MHDAAQETVCNIPWFSSQYLIFSDKITPRANTRMCINSLPSITLLYI